MGPPGPSYGAPAGPPGFGAPAYGAPAGPPGGPGQLAEWPQRAASGAIDFVAIGIIGAIVQQGSVALGSLISLLGLAFGIYNAYLNGTTGQSVGKKIVGTRVVGEATGQPIGGGAGIIRWLCHIIDGIICGIGYLFPLWDAKKQTIADKIMKTVVITGQPKQSFGDAIKP
ncbi:RDD family protein [Aquihabitans sp. G128]|uniref:RDD family protein n=1 Tax=Aquihabitans sp. G128 TaxID=2849779 RepID=UPI001C22AB01|nr:RDD family protein [Aquihabitans sp. G128]QXC62118.1 RDD family protein [Aquihabitans sp. G128]